MDLLEIPSLEKVKFDAELYQRRVEQYYDRMKEDNLFNKYVHPMQKSFEEMFGYYVSIYPENKIKITKTIEL